MITMEELLGPYKLEDQPPDIQANLAELLKRANVVRAAWGRPLTVTSGLRSIEKQLEVYKAKAAAHQKPFEDGVFDEAKVPIGSQHLHGAAVDIYDPKLELTAWLKGDGVQLTEDTGLWFEEGNSDWCHMQIYPPHSGNRWFLP